MKRILIAGAALAAMMADAEAFNPADFSNRMMVAFPGYTGGETLAGFPALVRLDSAVTAQMQAGGADLRFADADGNSLPYEIENWDPAGVSTVWVRLAQLAPADTAIVAYWGNAQAGAPADSADVWSEYVGVWHLNEPDGALLDSTGNALHGNRFNTTPADGVSGSAQFFDGDARVRVPNAAAFDIGGNFTVSGWYKRSDTASSMNYARFFSKKDDFGAQHGWEAETDQAMSHIIRPRGNSGNNGSLTLLPEYRFETVPRVWRHLSVTFVDTGFAEVFVDGVLMGMTGINNVAADSPDDFVIASGWQGFVDEMRITPAARSGAWRAAEYDTVMNPLFAAFGGIEDNAVPAAPIATLNALDVAHDSAEIQGFASALNATPQDVLLYWGTADNVWEPSPVSLTLSDAGYFTARLAGLAHETKYWARFAFVNGGAHTWSGASVSFTTTELPEPRLGAVDFDFAPGSYGVTVNVAQLGVNSTLAFSWGASDGGTFAHTTNFTPVAGANTFALAGLQRGDTCYWQAQLASDTGDDEAAGVVVVAYRFTWTGGSAGNRLWSDPANWNPAGVPNSHGDSVTFNADAYNWNSQAPFVVLDIPVTIGSATFNIPNDGGNRHYAITGETLTFDNGAVAIPSQINNTANVWKGMDFQCPVNFASETHLNMVSPEENKWPFGISGDMDGPGPLVVTQGRLALMSGQGAAQTCRVPIQTILGPNLATSTFVLKRGLGDTIMETPQALHLGATSGDQWGTFLSGGGRLIVSDTAVTNTQPYSHGSIFNWGDSTLLITNKSTYVYTFYKDDRCLRFNGESGSGNSIIINDSFVRLPTIGFNATGNLIDVQDGATLTFLYDRPHRTIVFNNVGNTMRVGSGDPARPAIVDLNTMPMCVGVKVVDFQDFTMDDNLLIVASGGIITNGAIQVGYADFGNIGTYRDNRIEVLDGGAIHSFGPGLIGVSTIPANVATDNTGNYVLVASDTATPSLWDLHNGNLTVGSQVIEPTDIYATTNNALRLGFGGVVTNAAAVQIGNANSTENRLSLEGGALYCDSLAIAAGNFLAPVLTPDGLQPVRVAGVATLESGARIVAETRNETTGVFPLLTATQINADLATLGDIIAPSNFAWKLMFTDNGETQTLRLACHKLNTLLILR